MAEVAVDVGLLATFYSLPEPTIQSLLTEPTIELVQSLLSQIEAKAREQDELRTDQMRSDVELEAQINDSNTRAHKAEEATKEALKEAEKLRQKLSQEETARKQIETELQTLKATATNSTSEVQALESRVKTLESQNRDTVALHEAKSAAHDRLAEELSSQHKKLVSLRQRASELEEKCQSLENSATSVRMREQNFEKEIEILKKNSDYFESELKTRAAEHTKLRKEKNAQLAELQRANADLSQDIETLRRTEASQRQNLQLLEQQLEEKISTIEQLQAQVANNEGSFLSELDSARRLAKLHQESANTAKAHLETVTAQADRLQTDAAGEIGQLQAEVETEQNAKKVLENCMAELEKQVEDLQSLVSELRSSANVPSTPRRGMNGPFDTPGRAGSPSFMTPGGSRGRAGLSTTQLYTENAQLKTELRSYQEREKQRQDTMDEILEELEHRQPDIDELKQENERLAIGNGEISALLEQSQVERETARKELRKAQGDYHGLQRECDLQRQQLQDMSVQINVLLLQQRLREQGDNSLSEQERQYLLQAIEHNVPAEDGDDGTDTGKVISRHLVAFRDIADLKTQNTELLRTIRQVAEQYEGSEAQVKAKQHEKDLAELMRMREKVAHYEEEIKSLSVRSQSFMKERDMFRRIVTSRGQLPSGSDSAPATPPRGNFSQSVDQIPRSKEIDGYERLIKELQAHSDALRLESAADHATLKKQVDDLAKENSRLQGSVMQLNNTNSLSRDRYELLQNKLRQLQSENEAIQKKCDLLQDSAAKQDILTGQAAEDLVEARSQVDRLERDITNLKQSQSLSKTIEERLSADNKAHVETEGRLNKMISDLQNLRNEQDLAEAENRRRLQSRADSLEAELKMVKQKLDDEVDDHKKAAMRRDYEQTETRKQLDDLTKALGDHRTELAIVKTERDQLQGRVNELKSELRAAEERGQNQHTRSAPAVNGFTDADEDEASREEALSAEVASLKHELEAALEQIDTAQTHIETYKMIAQEAEEQLESVHKAGEELQQEMERVLAVKEEEVKDLKQRVEEIANELATTNSELSAIRGTHEQEILRLVQQKESLEADVTKIKEEADVYKSTADFHEEDKKAQAEIATRAQQNYEHEVGKHGETMNNLRNTREEFTKLKSEVTQYKSEKEAAHVSLEQGEKHWTEQRDRYERELAEGQTRYDDLNKQNKILHQQLENVSSQIAGLKSSRVSIAGGDPDATDADPDTAGLQEVVRYLRKENEIVELQHGLALKEANRLKLQLDSTQNQLDVAREKLAAEQQSQTQDKQNASSLKTLQETIEQLNVYRESSSSLRNEARQAQNRLKEKSVEVDRLHAQIEPLQSRVHEIEGQLSIKVGEIELLQKDRDHWQKRHQDVISNYGRIDPQIVTDLKTDLATMTAERDQAQEQISGFEERLTSEKAALREECETEARTRRETLITKSKDKVRSLNNSIREKDSAIQTLTQDVQAMTQERDDLRQQLSTVQKDLETTKAAYEDAIAKAANADTAMGEEGQIDESSPGLSKEEQERLEARAKESQDWQNKFFQEQNKATGMAIQAELLEKQIKTLEIQVAELQQRIGILSKESAQAQDQAKQAEGRVRELESQQSSAPPATTTQTSPDIEKLREELVAAQKEAEDLRTRVDMAGSSVENNVVGSTIDVSEEVARQVASIKAQLDSEVEKRVEAVSDEAIKEKLQARTDKMKTQLNERLKQGRDSLDKEKQKLIAEHQTEIERIRQEAAAPVEPNVKPEGLPTPDSSDIEIKNFVRDTPIVQDIIRRTVTTQVDKFKAEQQKMVPEKVPEKVLDQAPDTAAIKAAVDAAKEQTEAMYKAKMSLTANRAALAKHKVEVVEQAAKATPQRPVVEVWDVIKLIKTVPSAPVPAATAVPAPASGVAQAPTSSTDSQTVLPTTTATATATAPPTQTLPQQPPMTVQSGSGQKQSESQTASQPLAFPAPLQSNGTSAGMGQTGFAQPNFGQNMGQNTQFGRPTGMPLNQGNTFQQFAPGTGMNRPGHLPEPMAQNFGSIVQPNFGLGGQPGSSFGAPMPQNLLHNARPNSPFAQQLQQSQQPQQGGRGGRESIGTGPAALRGLVGQQGVQTGIPRGGGTGIPRPGGRGGLNQQNQNPSQGLNIQGASGSQIGRGGNHNGRGRGGRGGGGAAGGSIQTSVPGGQGQGQSSPRTLNPGAQQFQPPAGAGRGQKRAHDDGGGDDGSDRGGKRFRGRGRGGE